MTCLGVLLTECCVAGLDGKSISCIVDVSIYTPWLWARLLLAFSNPLLCLKLRTRRGDPAGYWAYCLRERDVDVTAYDKYPPVTTSEQPMARFTTVITGGPEALGLPQNRNRCIPWPLV
jgi:hypothetical protein